MSDAATQVVALTNQVEALSNLFEEVLEKDHIFLLLSAVISASFGIGGSLLFRWLHLRDAKKAAEVTRLHHALKRLSDNFALYRLYADPLLSAARSLQTRLEEFTSSEERGVWFKVGEPQSPFVEYKYVGTLYRLAVFLGWIRAFHRDRARLDPFNVGNELRLKKQIESIQGTLADGQRVERQRTDNLINDWKLAKLDHKADQHKKLCWMIDGEINRARHWEGDYVKLRQLPPERKLEFCKVLASGVRTILPAAPIPDFTLESAVAVVDRLCIHEALIYRDTQQAIGDMVLIEHANGTRRYEVVGFRSFIDKFGTPDARKTSADARWFRDLDGLFNNLDMSKDPGSDSRPVLIRDLSDKLGQLIESLDWIQSGVEQEAARLEAKLIELEQAGAQVGPAPMGEVHVGGGH